MKGDVGLHWATTSILILLRLGGAHQPLSHRWPRGPGRHARFSIGAEFRRSAQRLGPGRTLGHPREGAEARGEGVERGVTAG